MGPQDTTSPFPHLFQPGRLGTMEVRNRLVMCPMADGFARADGVVGDREIEYYAARARGGVGLIIVGSCVVAYPRAAFTRTMTGISDAWFLPGLMRLTRRVQSCGAKIAAQLVHDGVYAMEDVAAGRPLLVPSRPLASAPDRLALMASPAEMAARMAPFQVAGARLAYKEADEGDLADVVATFAKAAVLAREAGFDGVEIHAGHGYLIDTFLSPALNRRTDRWGGALENRARLLCEIVRAVRARVGRDYPVWCRLNAFERFVENGETLDDAIGAARLAVAAGLDAIHVTANANPALGIAPTASHTPHEPGALLDSAAAVRRAINVPIIAFGRVGADEAERAIADAQADFIAMGRKLLADPDLPNKLARGEDQDVRPCIYHYRCIGNLYLRGPLACVVNPELGAEQRARPVRTTAPRRILVVGGGVAGLETARRLALAGAQVILAERTETLGGQLNAAANFDPDIAALRNWLCRAVARLAIDIRTGQKVDDSFISMVQPDALVVAVGGRWVRPSIPGADLPHVRFADDSRLQQDLTLNTHVAVIGGGKAGLSIAMAAAQRGAQVTVIEKGALFAPELGPPGRARWVHDLEHAGARLHAAAQLLAITPHAVVSRTKDGAVHEIPATLVIAAEDVAPTIWHHTGYNGTVTMVGECAGARHIEGAMRDAARVATHLSDALGDVA